jgi:O-antigen/teichoic acid export membrane protein
VSWKLASQGLSQVFRLATTLVLVHILAPADYGLAAMALVLATFAIAFSDLGFGAVIVQRASLTPVEISTAFWISVAAGTVFSTATALLAGPIAAAYGHEAVKPLILGLSPIFLLDSLATTQRALLARAVDFRSLELRSVVSMVAGSAVGIGVAMRGGGAWSLISQELTVAAAGILLLWRISAWRPSFAFSPACVREFAGFAARKTGARFLGDLTDTGDNILVGRFLGAAPLAIYAVAYKAALRPMVNFVGPLQEVLFPVLSRAQNDPRRVGDAWLRVTRVTGAVTLPLLVGMAVLAPEFVHVVLGARWHAAVEPLQVLAIVGAAQALTASTWSVFGALNAMQLSLRLAGARTIMNLGAFVVGLHWGIGGVALAYAVASVALLLPMIELTARRVGLTAGAFFRVLAGAAQACCVMAAAVVALRRLLIAEGFGPSVRLVVLSVIGATVYLGMLAWRDRTLRQDVRGVARSVARRQSQALA